MIFALDPLIVILVKERQLHFLFIHSHFQTLNISKYRFSNQRAEDVEDAFL